MPPSVGSVEMTNSTCSWMPLAGKYLLYDVLPAHAVAVLFLDGAHDHDLVALGDEVQVLHDLGAVGGGGHAALLVGAAAAADQLVILVALVGVGVPVVDVADANGVDVGVDGDDLVAVAHPADDVAKAVDLHLVEAQLLHLGLDAGNDLALLAGLGLGWLIMARRKRCHILACSPRRSS